MSEVLEVYYTRLWRRRGEGVSLELITKPFRNSRSHFLSFNRTHGYKSGIIIIRTIRIIQYAGVTYERISRYWHSDVGILILGWVKLLQVALSVVDPGDTSYEEWS